LSEFIVINLLKSLRISRIGMHLVFEGTTTISPDQIETIMKNKKFKLKNSYKYKTEKFNSGICCSNHNLIFNNCHDFVHDCLETVGHPDIKKFVTYKDKARIFKIIREINTKKQNIKNTLKGWFDEIMENIENCFGPTITNVSNEEKDEYSCFSLIDQSLLGTNDLTLSTNNLNGRCGPNYGRCPSGQCCGKNGKCGTKATICSKQNGCQPNYGKCKNIKIVTKKKVVKIVVTKKNNHH